MKEAKTQPVNRLSQPPPNPKPPEKRVEEVMNEARQRKRANKEIDALLRLFHGRKTILQLLPAMKQRGFPRYVIDVAIERVERRITDDDIEGRVELMAFKASLQEAG